MKLSLPEFKPINWKHQALDGWGELCKATRQISAQAGNSDAFQKIREDLQAMVRSHNVRVLPKLLTRRIVVRALTQLWLESATFRGRLLKIEVLDVLVEQQPQLGLVPLQHLITLYFREYDRLNDLQDGLQRKMERVIKGQLAERYSAIKKRSGKDILVVLSREAEWLLSAEGPRQLIRYVQASQMELAAAFTHFELRGLDSGRFADVCRSHYYLETLRNLTVGEDHEVFAELLRPSVCKAPYEGGKRIGHIAMEILIDRADGDPGKIWQNFIMDLAGDPRIASTATNYRQWWKPVGDDRIDKVRGWLAKEDLRLFLRALEQYGEESQDESMQRMFPARKQFLEGLEKLNMVRRTRLMLGSKAEYAVKRILGDELKTCFVRLSMADKAVIYVDCGDFCLVEGSHAFSLWVYLAPPSDLLKSYSVNKLSHSDLTKTVPMHYRQKYGDESPMVKITHYPFTWQNKIFNFLGKHGIALDIEFLLSADEYDNYLARYGMPVIKLKKTELHVQSNWNGS